MKRQNIFYSKKLLRNEYVRMKQYTPINKLKNKRKGNALRTSRIKMQEFRV